MFQTMISKHFKKKKKLLQFCWTDFFHWCWPHGVFTRSNASSFNPLLWVFLLLCESFHHDDTPRMLQVKTMLETMLGMNNAIENYLDINWYWNIYIHMVHHSKSMTICPTGSASWKGHHPCRFGSRCFLDAQCQWYRIQLVSAHGHHGEAAQRDMLIWLPTSHPSTLQTNSSIPPHPPLEGMPRISTSSSTTL